MADATEILGKLQPLFQEIFDIPDLVVTPTMTARDVGEWDSLNHIRLISAAEQRFGVRLTSAEVESMKCVGDFAALIAKKV